MRMETLLEAVSRFEQAGYRDQFRALDGELFASVAGRSYAPESLQVDEVARFEGASNPSDESMVFALRSADDDVRGTYVVAYGPDMDVADSRIVTRLRM